MKAFANGFTIVNREYKESMNQSLSEDYRSLSEKAEGKQNYWGGKMVITESFTGSIIFVASLPTLPDVI